MSTSLRDLWPDDLSFEEVATPLMILEHQAEQLESRSNGIIRAEVTQTRASDRVEFGFEVIVPALGYRTCLFKVQGDPDREFPVVVIPPAPLPDFLRSHVYRSGTGLGSALLELKSPSPGRWEDNPWVASTEQEFVSQLEMVLGSPEVKSLISSLIVRSTKKVNGDAGH